MAERTDGENTPRIMVPLPEPETDHGPMELQLLAVHATLLQVEPLTQEQHILVSAPFPSWDGLRTCGTHSLLPRLKPPL